MSTQSENANAGQNRPQGNMPPAEPPLVTTLFHVEGILKIVFIPSIFLLPGYAGLIVVTICLLGIFRQLKKPQFNKEWGRKLLMNEFTQNLFYMVPFFFFPGSRNLVYYLPLGIHFWIGFCQYVFLKQPGIYKTLQKYVDFTRQNDRILKIQKAKLEIYQMGFILLFAILGQGSIFLVLLYGNFLRIKYMLNPTTQLAFGEINYWIEGKINSPSCPGILRMVVQKVRSLCQYLVKMS